MHSLATMEIVSRRVDLFRAPNLLHLHLKQSEQKAIFTRVPDVDLVEEKDTHGR